MTQPNFPRPPETSAPPRMYLPMIGVGNQIVSLPGLPGGPTDTGTASPDLLLPPGVRPIMGASDPISGDMTGTLMPLADPLPPQPPVLPIEVASSALPEGAFIEGIPGMDVPAPQLPLFPEVPPSPGAALPGMEPLAEPLPTAVGPNLRPWPPLTAPYDVPPLAMPPLDTYPTPDLPGPPPPMQAAPPEETPPVPPLPAGLPGIESQMSTPHLLPYEAPFFTLPGVEPYAAPDMPQPVVTPLEAAFPILPEVHTEPGFTPEPVVLALPPDLEPAVAEPPEVTAAPLLDVFAPPVMPAPAVGEPLEGSLIPGAEALAQAMAAHKDHEDKAQRFADERGKLRAPVPSFADGKVLWEQVWGNP